MPLQDAVRKEGGKVWNAYIQAEQGEIFWLEELDSLPLCKKGEELWGTGPKLDESFVDALIEGCGGHRLTAEEAGEFREKNADYILGDNILELKHFENEGLSVETRQQKIAEIFQKYLGDRYLLKIDPYKLSDRDFEEYWNVLGVPVQKRVKAASKQVKTSIARLGADKYEGGIILLNTGYLSIPDDFLVAMAERYASKDTSSIKNVIVISSWTITNGFDTVVNYGFHPHEPAREDFKRLQSVFWGKIEDLMTKILTGEYDKESGVQQPMKPIYFNLQGKVFTFGVPELESQPKKNDY